MPRLAQIAPLVTISRRPPTAWTGASVKGFFGDARDLAALDRYQISAIIHLAAVLENATFEDATAVNVLGTRHLLRYALDRQIRRIVIASSIAATGCLSSSWSPATVPIEDDVPWLRAPDDAYGWSKYTMEQEAMATATPGISLILFRLGVVVGDHSPPVPIRDLATEPFPFAVLGSVGRSDVDRAFIHALTTKSIGARRMNLVSQATPTAAPTAEALRVSRGRLDGIEHFGRECNRWRNVYSTARLHRFLAADRARTTAKEPLDVVTSVDTGHGVVA